MLPHGLTCVTRTWPLCDRWATSHSSWWCYAQCNGKHGWTWSPKLNQHENHCHGWKPWKSWEPRGSTSHRVAEFALELDSPKEETREYTVLGVLKKRLNVLMSHLLLHISEIFCNRMFRQYKLYRIVSKCDNFRPFYHLYTRKQDTKRIFVVMVLQIGH